jgi:hypothetical protein
MSRTGLPACPFANAPERPAREDAEAPTLDNSGDLCDDRPGGLSYCCTVAHAFTRLNAFTLPIPLAKFHPVAVPNAGA